MLLDKLDAFFHSAQGSLHKSHTICITHNSQKSKHLKVVGFFFSKLTLAILPSINGHLIALELCAITPSL